MRHPRSEGLQSLYQEAPLRQSRFYLCVTCVFLTIKEQRIGVILGGVTRPLQPLGAGASVGPSAFFHATNPPPTRASFASPMYCAVLGATAIQPVSRQLFSAARSAKAGVGTQSWRRQSWTFFSICPFSQP